MAGPRSAFGICLTTDVCLTEDLGVSRLIPARSHTFMKIEHEKFLRSFFYLPLNQIDSRRVVVSYKQKYVHEVLVNCLVKLAHEKVWLGELTIPT